MLTDFDFWRYSICILIKDSLKSDNPFGDRSNPFGDRSNPVGDWLKWVIQRYLLSFKT